MKIKINKKECIKCHKLQPLGKFPRYKNRKGIECRVNVCKECRAIYIHNHYLQHMDDYKRRSREQKESDPEGYKKYLREHYLENAEAYRNKSKIYSRKYRVENPEKYREVMRRWEHSNPEKVKAHKKVMNALRSGKLLRPTHCEICGKECKPEAHHWDYSKPLDVLWCCRICHNFIHTLLNEGTISPETPIEKISELLEVRNRRYSLK